MTDANSPQFQAMHGPSSEAWVASHYSFAYHLMRLFLSDDFIDNVSTQTKVYSLSQKYRRSTWVESLRAPGGGIGGGPSKAGGAVAADRATATGRPPPPPLPSDP